MFALSRNLYCSLSRTINWLLKGCDCWQYSRHAYVYIIIFVCAILILKIVFCFDLIGESYSVMMYILFIAYDFDYYSIWLLNVHCSTNIINVLFVHYVSVLSAISIASHFFESCCLKIYIHYITFCIVFTSVYTGQIFRCSLYSHFT